MIIQISRATGNPDIKIKHNLFYAGDLPQSSKCLYASLQKMEISFSVEMTEHISPKWLAMYAWHCELQSLLLNAHFLSILNSPVNKLINGI
jgi:hypothetical protein